MEIKDNEESVLTPEENEIINEGIIKIPPLRFLQITFDIGPEKPKIDLKHFPHSCPHCNSPAYVGVAPRDVDCSNADCQCHRNDHT